MKDRMEEVSLKMKLEKMDLENKLQKTQHHGNEKIQSQHIKHLLEKEELEMVWKGKLTDLDEYYKGFIQTKQAEHKNEIVRVT